MRIGPSARYWQIRPGPLTSIPPRREPLFWVIRRPPRPKLGREPANSSTPALSSAGALRTRFPPQRKPGSFFFRTSRHLSRTSTLRKNRAFRGGIAAGHTLDPLILRMSGEVLQVETGL